MTVADTRTKDEPAVKWTFDGEMLHARDGQTVAGALLDSGRNSWRQTPNGRPRGLFCGIGLCHDCLVTIDGRPNVRACLTPAVAGLVVESRQDSAPESSPPLEPVIARHPGADGRAGANGREAIRYAEVAVVGAGPAGLAAALAAARTGARVTVVDSYRQPGGQYFRQPASGVSPTAHQRQGQALWQRVAAAGADLLTGTTVWGAFPGNLLALEGPSAPSYLQSQAIILATGAYDRPVAFPGWTLPGVMTAGAAQTLLKEQGVLAGRRVLLAGTGPLQLVLGAALVRAGAQVAALLEGSALFPDALRHVGALWGQWERLAEGLEAGAVLAEAGVLPRPGWGVVAAHGKERVERASIARLDRNWRRIPGSEEIIECDAICLGYGFLPWNPLALLMGAAMEWRPALGGLVARRDPLMRSSQPGLYVAGDGAGIGGAALALLEGRIAGLAAAAETGHGGPAAREAINQLAAELARERRFQQFYGELFTPGPGLFELANDDTIICRCEEVPLSAVRRAVTLGAETAAEIKSVTRCGMGECQGRMCSHLVAETVARQTGRSVPEVGLFRPRPPLFPVPVAGLAEQVTGA